MGNLSEEDVKNRYITPAIQQVGWNPTDYRMEYPYTDGRITVINNYTKQNSRKKIDYLLNYRENYPLAIIEAKDLKHTYNHGIQQGIGYAEGLKHAKSLEVPFVYATNGRSFLEHDMLTGQERSLAMNEFPTKEAMWQRYKKEKGLSQEELQVVEEPYYSTREANQPRYYQRVAINRTVEAIASGRQRALLVMATGTGKTFTAFQIVYRLLQAGFKKRVLYLADRNILVDQAMTGDFSPLLGKATKVQKGKLDSSYQIHFALYQQLAGRDEDEGHEPFRQFKPDFFDLVVIDEAHRGSVKADSQWRKILNYFDGPNVTHFGMTATPKNEKGVSNIDYFGEPIYTYSLKQGIDDGFLAPYRVIRVNLDVDVTGYRPHKGEHDANGELIVDREYTASDFDRTLVIDDRTKQVAHYVSEYLKQGKTRLDKTIVFCEDIDHANRMRMALVNENTDIVSRDSRYVMTMTSSDNEGKAQLSNFEDVGSKYPTIAVTSKLLTTGVNVKTCKLIVLDQNINSMTEFKQIIGRGTRIDKAHGKEFFTIIDFRGATRLFADPSFDGEPDVSVETGDNNVPSQLTHDSESGNSGDDTDPENKPHNKYYVNNRKVRVLNDQVEYLDASGHLMTTSLRDYTKKNILGQYATLDKFLEAWHTNGNKQKLLDKMEQNGIFYQEIINDEKLTDMDPFDLIVHLAYNQKPLSKSERVAHLKKSGLLDKYQGTARDILETLLTMYQNDGIQELENSQVLSLPEFERYGGTFKIIVNLFGGKKKYQDAVFELKEKIYN